jgi:hypothetical protein
MVPLSHKLCVYFWFVHLFLPNFRLIHHHQALDVRTALNPRQYSEVGRTMHPYNPRTQRLQASCFSFPQSVLLLLVLLLGATLEGLPNKLATCMDNIRHRCNNQPPTSPLQQFANVATSYSWIVVLQYTQRSRGPFTPITVHSF